MSLIVLTLTLGGGIIVPPPEPLGTKKYVEPLRVNCQQSRLSELMKTFSEFSKKCQIAVQKTDF